MQISKLYEKSTMGEKLKNFFQDLIQNQTTNQTLRNRDLYDSGKLHMTHVYMTNFMMQLSDIMSKYSIGVDLDRINSFLVSPFGQNLINHPDKSDDEVIGMTVQECTSVKLEEILLCSDFIDVFNSPESNTKNQLQDLLSKHQHMNYEDIKKAVEVSLSPEDKKIFFAKVLPTYDFKVCNEFYSTWDMFKNGYIDFDTLVTKFWDRENFDQDQNNKDQQNAFQTFASKYKSYADYQNNDIGSLKSSTENMIYALKQKGVIAGNYIQNLKDQIDDATDV